MASDLLYQISLTLVPNIGTIQAKTLVSHFGTAESVFKAKKQDDKSGKDKENTDKLP